MKNIAKIISLLCLLAVTGYGQSTQHLSENNSNLTGDLVQRTNSMNWIVENLFIEITLVEHLVKKTITSKPFINFYKKQYSHSSNWLDKNNSSTILFFIEIDSLNRLSPSLKEAIGTSPVHVLPKSFPQTISVIPSQIKSNRRSKDLPKAFGGVYQL